MLKFDRTQQAALDAALNGHRATLVPMRIQMQPIFTDQSKALMVQSRGENATQRKGKRMPS